jgi:hypothetical protein
VVVEVTERAVAGDPARLLATVAQARQAGWGVALDDVGATIGQGFLFGHPAPLPSAMPPPGEAIPLRNAPPTGNPATPWEVVASAREPRRATKDLLVEMCMQLEHQGLDSAEPNLLLACFQEADQFTPAARSRYEFLATRAAFPAPSATACRSPRWPGSAAPTWPPTTRCAASGT